jgi:hypothetical protein
MASNGSFTTSYCKNLSLMFSWSIDSQSIANNTTTISWSLKGYRTDGATGYITCGGFKVVIDGTTVLAKPTDYRVDVRNGDVVASGKHTISHASDGTKTFTAYAEAGIYYSAINASGTATFTLTTIARASTPTVSASSVVMLNKVTINTNRLSSSFTHDLTYSFGGSTGTIATGVGASYEWKVPDLVSKISGKTSGTCTITCKTKNGSTEVGSKTVTLTLTIPAKSTPTASATTVKMGKSVTINTNRKSSGYTHTITYAMGTTSGTIATGVDSSVAWTPPTDLAYHTDNKTSGTCTITCSTYTGSKLVGSSAITITLTVPDASVPSVSASTVALGNQVTISIQKYADAFTHDLTYTLTAEGSSTVVDSGTLATGIGVSHDWTVPLPLAAKMPSATKGTITITCTSRFPYTTTVVGSNKVSFTVTVPNNSTTQPKVTVSLSPVSDLPSAFSGIYVAGKSQVEVSYSASSDYSTIVSYHTSVNGGSGSSNPYTSTLLKDSGTVTITCKVTDARGYFTTLTRTIEVIPYGRPRIIPGEGQQNIVCTRCNSDGTADPGGVYLMIKVGRKYEKVVSGGSQKNYCKLSYRFKTDAQAESAYSSPVTLLERTAAGDHVSQILSGIVTSNITAYNVQIIAEDDIGETDTFTITVPTVFVTFHAPAGGHGFTLGGYHDPDKYDVFDCRFDAEFHGTVSGSVMGLLGSSGDIPGDGDLNDYKTPGVYAVSTDNNAKTISNMPPAIDRAGLLRVYAALGQDYVTEGTWKYITQEYRSLFPGTPDYRRRLWTDGTGTWSYGPWVTGIDDVLHLAGTATQITGNIYTENGVETCQFMIRAGSDYHVLNLSPSGMVYGKNGKVLWTK